MEWLVEVALKYTWRFIAVTAVAFVLVGGFIWYQAVWLSPGKVFEDMLANNLAVTSVTKHSVVGSTTQGVEQTIRLQLGSTNAADWFVVAKQLGSSVTTEEIGTPSAGYLRYVAVAAPTGSSARYAPLLNIWAKSDGKTDTDLSQLFAGTLLDIDSAPTPPIANLLPVQRENLLAFIRDNQVFTPDYGRVKSDTSNGRSTYTFSVAVNLAAYVRLMQAFAHYLGLTRLDQLDPNQYVGAPPATVLMSVDKVSHQLVKVAYVSSGFSQTYSDWGLQSTIEVPSSTLTTTELQRRLQAAAKAV